MSSSDVPPAPPPPLFHWAQCTSGTSGISESARRRERKKFSKSIVEEIHTLRNQYTLIDTRLQDVATKLDKLVKMQQPQCMQPCMPSPSMFWDASLGWHYFMPFPFSAPTPAYHHSPAQVETNTATLTPEVPSPTPQAVTGSPTEAVSYTSQTVAARNDDDDDGSPHVPGDEADEADCSERAWYFHIPSKCDEELLYEPPFARQASFIGEIIEFELDRSKYFGKLIGSRDAGIGVEHSIEYLDGETEWIKLDMEKKRLTDKHGHADVPYTELGCGIFGAYTKGTILGESLLWKSGLKSKISYSSLTEFSTELLDTVFTGVVRQNQIFWNDGDEWQPIAVQVPAEASDTEADDSHESEEAELKQSSNTVWKKSSSKRAKQRAKRAARLMM